jgi:uncharacterized protein (TIGR02145 family)
MKVTYFNPSAPTVTIGSNSYPFYPTTFTTANCTSLDTNNIAYFRDIRNNQTYKVKRMADGKCWMVDNLKYAGEEHATLSNVDGTKGLTYNNTSGAYNTVNGSGTPQSDTNFDKAFYNNPMSTKYCSGTTNIPANSLTRCGYLYSWYATTAGTGKYEEGTQYSNVTGSICPTNFHLPKSYDGKNGALSSTTDFPYLNGMMRNGGGASTDKAYFYNWLPANSWLGIYSGYWVNSLGNQGAYGFFWSSTVSSGPFGYILRFDGSTVNPASIVSKYYGQGVRCVIV